jgi:hypothetical protein
MPHTVINGAPLTFIRDEESMSETAFSVAEEFHDWQQSLQAALVQSWRVLDNRDHGIGEG